ncbi:MAG TPA: SRPBCC family protein [Microscillaceae bacterium]|nr:SRPBCC family protein [Microscillaceae bacterium]
MKTIQAIFALALLFISAYTFKAKAQNAQANVTITKVIEVSADKVWSVLRKMDDIQKYSSFIARLEWKGNRGVGGERVCYSPDGKGYYKEGIVHFDDANRTYSYAVKEGVPAKNMVNSFKVVDLGYNKSMIVWTSNFEQFLKNPQMTQEQFMGFLNKAITEMITNVTKAAKKTT